MELVYQNKLVHYLGTTEEHHTGAAGTPELPIYHFSFRDSAGEKFEILCRQPDVPNSYFSCNEPGLERALQEILERAENNSPQYVKDTQPSQIDFGPKQIPAKGMERPKGEAQSQQPGGYHSIYTLEV